MAFFHSGVHFTKFSKFSMRQGFYAFIENQQTHDFTKYYVPRYGFSPKLLEFPLTPDVHCETTIFDVR